MQCVWRNIIYSKKMSTNGLNIAFSTMSLNGKDCSFSENTHSGKEKVPSTVVNKEIKGPITLDFLEKNSNYKQYLKLISSEAKFMSFIEWPLCVCVCVCVCIFESCWLHKFSWLSLSLYSSLSSIAPDRFSKLHSVSAQTWCNKFFLVSQHWHVFV